ncbi:STAS domain-containing protein [Megalodesulfovibrio paquesii]
MRIALEGACTVAEMAALKERLLLALQRGEAVALSFAQVTRGDLAFFELLLAARRCFAAKGVPLTLQPDMPAALAFGAHWTGLGELCPHPHAAPATATPGGACHASH